MQLQAIDTLLRKPFSVIYTFHCSFLMKLKPAEYPFPLSYLTLFIQSPIGAKLTD